MKESNLIVIRHRVYSPAVVPATYSPPVVMVGEVGIEPTKSEDVEFTAQLASQSAPPPRVYLKVVRAKGIEPSMALWPTGSQPVLSTVSSTPALVVP